jgi:hypothetical protein
MTAPRDWPSSARPKLAVTAYKRKRATNANYALLEKRHTFTSVSLRSAKRLPHKSKGGCDIKPVDLAEKKYAAQSAVGPGSMSGAKAVLVST